MNSTPRPAQSAFSKGSLPVKSLVDRLNIEPTDLKKDRLPSGRLPHRERVPLVLARFLITFSFGVAATAAWQCYGDASRERIVSSFPQLDWPARQAAPVAQNAPDVIALATLAPPSPNQQPLSAISLDLDAVRQSIDRLAGSQEQMTRNVDQLVAG
jgi:hypothetical protein